MFRLPLSLPLLALAFTGAALLPSSPLRACGPDFPNAYLVTPGEELAALPTLSFRGELARLLPPGTVKPETPPPDDSPGTLVPIDPELAEVRAVLAVAGIPAERIESLLATYQRPQPPSELPAEFHLYAEGARAWHAGQPEQAVRAWRRLLALPAAQRQYRTTWAAYMIGRALWDREPRAAQASFRATRDAARQGFADSENLATASLGWEARSYLHQANYPEALRLYFQQFAAGDPTATNSLQKTLRLAFREEDDLDALEDNDVPIIADKALRRLAADPQLRGIVNAWFVSRGGPHAPWSARATEQFNRWLGSLPRNRSLTAEEAERWAWAAYQNGRWTEAADFAALASESAPAAAWVRAMLQLREGNVAAAADQLATAARAFPQDAALGPAWFAGDEGRFSATGEDLPDSQLGGVRGVLALQREQYLEALRLFVLAGHWADAAYLAERVLSLAELREFVATEVPAPEPAAIPTLENVLRRSLRELLARRLVRAGQFAAARDYFSPELVPIFDDYVGQLKQGYLTTTPAVERAAALWRAARLAREHGMELQGTELGPDYAIWGGGFEWPDIGAFRETGGSGDPWLSAGQRVPVARVNFAVPAEIERLAGRNLPTRRFHYRQRAAELALLAATLLPDNDARTAAILNTAGRWVAARYPEDAQLFYKTLVFRCPDTDVGRTAAERRWFAPGETLPVFEK